MLIISQIKANMLMGMSEKVEIMSDLKKYIAARKKSDKNFAKNCDEGYEQFKVGVLLRGAHQSAGQTQEELARRLKTKKTA